MTTLPAIPADLSPAPRPRIIDPLSLSDAALRAWQDGRQAGDQYAYLDGPTPGRMGERRYILFPTFGHHIMQSRLLQAAGYMFAAGLGGWVKWLGERSADDELDWARRLYAALHPGWKPRAELSTAKGVENV